MNSWAGDFFPHSCVAHSVRGFIILSKALRNTELNLGKTYYNWAVVAKGLSTVTILRAFPRNMSARNVNDN